MRIRNGRVRIRNARVNIRPNRGLVSFVFSQKATVPADHSSGASNTLLATPVPFGTQEGDLMVAVFGQQGGHVVSTPVGWTLVETSFHANPELQKIYTKTASDSEPTFYVWSIAPKITSLSGSITTLESNVGTPSIEVITKAATPIGTSGTFPSAANTVNGSMLLAIVANTTTGVADGVVEYTPTSPLTEGTEHSSRNGAYTLNSASAAFYEADIPVDTISGRSFTIDKSFVIGTMFSIIVNP